MTHFAQRELPLPSRPVAVDMDDIARQPNGHAVIALCAQKAGKEGKVIAHDLGIQEAVWSRVKSGINSLSLDDLVNLMVACGNDAPLIWLLMKRGYDPHSLRPSESELARQLREERERHQREMAEERERSKADKIRAETLLEAFRMRGGA